jgi:hypothetical protein
LYIEIIPAGSFLSNASGTSFKYKLKKTGSPMIYNFKIKRKIVKARRTPSSVL